MDTPIALMLEGMPWAIAEKPFSAAEEGELAMPTPSDTARDALHQAAYEFARELVRALELDTLDGVATALSCGVTLEVPTDGTAPRIRLDLTNTAVDPPFAVKPPADGSF